MDNITIVKNANNEDYVIIDRGNNEFTSMPKSDYDKQQAEQSTPNLAE
jgi:hypothetical protein